MRSLAFDKVQVIFTKISGRLAFKPFFVSRLKCVKLIKGFECKMYNEEE